MTTIDTLKERYSEVKERIARSAARAGADARAIVLIAVSKYSGVDQIRELLAMGHVDFGESQVQQLVHRAAMIEESQRRHKVVPNVGGGEARLSPRWHMVGHLQRNKARKALEVCRLVHSVDSLRLAEEIQTAAVRAEQVVDVLVQVNASGEASKFGCAPAACIHLCEQIDTMVNVRVRGLMTMAPHSEHAEDSRGTFGRCRELFEEVRKSGIGSAAFNILSMGMSNDFEVAISEGSNMVRVGSAIFGPPAPGASDSDDDGEPEPVA